MEEHVKTYGEFPFFLFLSYYAVHTPLQAKPELSRKYVQKLKNMGADSMQMETTDRDWIRHAPNRGRYVERIRQGHPVYAGMIETLDMNVGKLMAALEGAGLEENTVVIFMSDNGGLATAEGSPTSNLPLRAGKGWLYEGGIREPMLIRWPGSGSAGTTCDVPVTSTDFYPTILEMAGLEPMPSQHADGMSLVPLITGAPFQKNRPIFWHYPHYSNQGGKPGAAVRLGEYKLIEFLEDNTVELYNLSLDPGERDDLSGAAPQKTQELLGLLHHWQEVLGAEGMDPNPGFDTDYLRQDTP